MYLKKLKIGNVELENNLLLAPMAGITDLPFRRIVKKYGAGLVCTEMVSAKGIFYKDEKTRKLLNMEDEKRPVAVQIFGSDIEAMAEAAIFTSKFADIVDINMGCPAPKVVKNGEGSKLLLDLKKVEEIAKVVVENSLVPVTAKIRKGFNNSNIVAVEAAKILEDAGVSAITIHGRTREEYFGGNVDLNVIKKVKENVNIPVIGNGDIVDEESAKRMFEYTGVDGIMIGRGTFGNPWIFKNIITYLETGEKEGEISLQERKNVILKQLELEILEKGENIAIREMRKHLAWYVKGLKESSKFRGKINKLETKKEVIQAVNEYFYFLGI